MLWKDFGANGFYGNAPSHEWTNQSLFAVDHRFDAQAGGSLALPAHADARRPLPVRCPAASIRNRHRTHATLAALRAHAPWAIADR